MTYTFIARACTDLPVSACCRVMRVSTSGFYSWQAEPGAGQGPRRRLSLQHHRRHLDHEPSFLWLASGPRRAQTRPGRSLLAQTGRTPDAPGADCRHPPASPRRVHPSGPRCPALRRPGQAGLRSHRARSLVGHGRHRAPDRERQGLPGRGPRRLLPARRGLVDRRSHAFRARRRRPPDGHLAPSSTAWIRPSRIPITGRPTPRGPSAGDSAVPACSAPWDRSAIASTTRVAESFFGTLQLELLDEHHWESRQQLAQAIFEWIEAWYNPRRRHSYCQMLSPVDYEAAHAA